jgi:phage shock protein PspC (stress-responsive transcriptional regulator)
MHHQKVKLLLTLSACAAVVAVLCAVATGSHIHFALSDGSPDFDFRLAVGSNGASTVLGILALVLFLAGVGLELSQGASGGDWGATGTSVVAWLSDFTGCLRRIARSSKDEWLGGVCGGLGEQTPIPSWAWRFLFLIALFCYGTGVLVYIALWICLPEPSREGPSQARREESKC